MRLLHTSTLEFREFFDHHIPKYAILSHRWTDHEVSFEQFTQYRVQDWGPVYAKIKDCCAFTQARGLQWVWIDTCCIDKRSSAELNEAINSMYRWYSRAKVCWAYLAEISSTLDTLGDEDGGSAIHAEFCASDWFTRGWTLQELLAPDNLEFLDRSWNSLGSKKKLQHSLSQATQIPVRDLFGDIIQQSIAKKMSWLSRRKTTRVEDMAYCMLRLCGVNMPLLYGEGERAFLRLQHEIIKVSDDESIFAWFSRHRDDRWQAGILAVSPKAFAKSGQIEAHLPMKGKRPFSMTNKGLQYHIPRPRKYLDRQPSTGERYSLLLDCGFEIDRWPDSRARASITIDLVYCTRGWERVISDNAKAVPYVEPMIQHKKELWESVIEKGCFFETIYIDAAGSCLGGKRADQWHSIEPFSEDESDDERDKG
ncbi:MAG: hypothetical protein Q9212_001521 [Teloschistes hypoglaucus]